MKENPVGMALITIVKGAAFVPRVSGPIPKSFVLVLILIASLSIAEEAPVPKTAPTVSADELFAVFVALRSSTVYENSIAQHEDPRFYTRQWLEDAIRSALSTTKEPDRPGLNWVQDSLLTKFGVGFAVQEVYGYELKNAESGHAALRMQVLDECNRALAYTIDFAFEDGAWRVSHTKSDSTMSGKSWFRSGMQRLREFPHIKLRDRARYINESTLGTALKLEVSNQECSAVTADH